MRTNGSGRDGIRRDSVVVGRALVRVTGPVSGDIRGHLVLVPGAHLGGWVFDGWSAGLAAAGWACYSITLRGHEDAVGMSDAEWVRTGLTDYLADVAGVCDWVGEPVVVLGHSMGGLLAQLMAARIECQGLVLLSSTGPGQLGPVNRPLFREDRPLVPRFDRVRQTWFADVADDVASRIELRLAKESSRVINECSRGDVWVDTSSVSCPVLVISGSQDRSLVHSPAAVAALYHADQLVVPAAGHIMMLGADSSWYALRRLLGWLSHNVPLGGV